MVKVIVDVVSLIIMGIFYLRLAAKWDDALAKLDVIESTVDGLRADLRVNHLQVMKALKGDSYAGQFGGVDMHTSSNVPPNSTYMVSRDGPVGTAKDGLIDVRKPPIGTYGLSAAITRMRAWIDNDDYKET